jgi:hypothetical protein
MTRCIDTSRKDAKAYPELGMRPTRIAAARPIAVRPPEANLGFSGSYTLEFAHFRRQRALQGRSLAGAAKQPRFSSNLSTFMSKIVFLAVTTLERSASGRCRTTILLKAHAFAPCGYLPAWGFFSSQFIHNARGSLTRDCSDVVPEIQPGSSKSEVITRISVYSSNVELDLTYF